MAIVLLETYQSDNGHWYARLENDATGQVAELHYATKPTAAQARADVIAVFNPPTVNLTAEDGSVVASTGSKTFDLSALTAPQKTAIANAETTLTTLVNLIAGKLSDAPPFTISQLRQHSPLFDALLTIRDRLSL